MIAFIRDLTERKRLEESVRYQAAHDELATGDALLIQVPERMRSVVRESDTLARMGGDEFAILVTKLVGLEEAVQIVFKLLVTLQASYRLNDQSLYSGAGVGVAFYLDGAQDDDTLLRYADLTIYQAKQAGRGTYACYSSDMDRQGQERMHLHTRLKEAIANNLRELHYQPQVGVERGLVVGVEALLRWNDPVLGQVSPARFIPVAEATGLILPLSAWVLQTACKQISIWSKNGMPLRVPIGKGHSASTVRSRTLRVGQRLDAELTAIQAPSVHPSSVISIGLDGGCVRHCDAQAAQSFEIIAGRVLAEDGSPRSVAFVRNIDEHSCTRVQHTVAALGGADIDLRAFTNGDGALRDLQIAVLPDATHALDCYHLTCRLTMLSSVISGQPAAAEQEMHDQDRLSECMDSLKWRLWHGRASGAIERLQDMLERMERLCKGTGKGKKQPAMKRMLEHATELQRYLQNNADRSQTMVKGTARASELRLHLSSLPSTR